MGKVLPTGVSRRSDKFIARMKVEDVTHHLGTFDTAEEAGEAYKEAKRQRRAETSKKEPAPIPIETRAQRFEKFRTQLRADPVNRMRKLLIEVSGRMYSRTPPMTLDDFEDLIRREDPVLFAEFAMNGGGWQFRETVCDLQMQEFAGKRWHTPSPGAGPQMVIFEVGPEDFELPPHTLPRPLFAGCMQRKDGLYNAVLMAPDGTRVDLGTFTTLKEADTVHDKAWKAAPWNILPDDAKLPSQYDTPDDPGTEQEEIGVRVATRLALKGAERMSLWDFRTLCLYENPFLFQAFPAIFGAIMMDPLRQEKYDNLWRTEKCTEPRDNGDVAPWIMFKNRAGESEMGLDLI